MKLQEMYDYAVNPFGSPGLNATRWIKDNWQAILKRASELGHPEWMPMQRQRRMMDAPGQQLLFEGADLQLGWRKLRKILGCGAFGCVYSTRDPSVVLKFTLDESEARLVQLLLNKFDDSNWPKGIVKYAAVFKLPETDMSRDSCYSQSRNSAYILWRDEVDFLGRSLGTFLHRNYSRDEILTVGNVVRNAFSASRYFQDKICRIKKRNLDLFYEEESEVMYDRAMEYLGEKYNDLFDYDLTSNMGEFFLDILTNFGVFSADVHRDNIGIIKSRGDWFVVTDPGMTQNFFPEFEQIDIPMI